jgi:predicted nucleotidyltransferase
MTPRIPVPLEAVNDFCQRWQVTEFALFGSVLRDDFGPESDVDVLVSFSAEAKHSLFDLVRMEDELRAMFGRRVDLVTRRAVERTANDWRRQSILGSLVHVAQAS